MSRPSCRRPALLDASSPSTEVAAATRRTDEDVESLLADLGRRGCLHPGTRRADFARSHDHRTFRVRARRAPRSALRPDRAQAAPPHNTGRSARSSNGASATTRPARPPSPPTSSPAATPNKRVRYCTLAAEHQLRRSAHREAIHHLRPRHRHGRPAARHPCTSRAGTAAADHARQRLDHRPRLRRTRNRRRYTPKPAGCATSSVTAPTFCPCSTACGTTPSSAANTPALTNWRPHSSNSPNDTTTTPSSSPDEPSAGRWCSWDGPTTPNSTSNTSPSRSTRRPPPRSSPATARIPLPPAAPRSAWPAG